MTDKNTSPRGCAPAQLQIVYPPEGETVRGLTTAFGWAAPGSPIAVYIDGQITARSCTDPCGHWRVPVRPAPADGPHCLCVTAGCAEDSVVCIHFSVGGRAQPLPAPAISYPTGSIPESDPLIRGTAAPGATVRVCVDSTVCTEVSAGPDGAWSWQYPGDLEEGYHVVTAAAISPEGVRSATAYQVFQTEGHSTFEVTLEDAHAGARFRTVALDLRIASTVYPVTLYYLLLPPGSPTPTAEEILRYTGPGLEDGTAAAGSVDLFAGGRRTVELTGRENAPAGSLGVVDSRRYDVYVVARAGGEQTPVLSAPSALAMPFAGGHGVSGDPYLIAELGREEIQQNYPDLAAGRSPLGVDDTARMLRNIENAQALYESSGGTLGLRNSMALDYRLTTPIDLSGYAAAEGGTGWTALGYQGDYQTPRYFSGLLAGAGAATPIRGLTIIREGLRESDGLFAASLDGEFQGLTLENSVIRLSVSDPEQKSDTNIGLLVTRMRGGSLRDIAVSGAEVTVLGTEEYGVTASFGGIAATADSLLYGENLLVERVRLDVPIPGNSYGPSGGMFGSMGIADEDSGFIGTVLDTILVQDCTFNTHGLFGGLAGYLDSLGVLRGAICRRCGFSVLGQVGGLAASADLALPNALLENLLCQDNTIEIRADPFTSYWPSGGMFAILFIDADSAVLRDAQVTGGALNGVRHTGGLIGDFRPFTDCVIEDCRVTGTQVTAAGPVLGGFCGQIMLRYIDLPQRKTVFHRCTVRTAGPLAGQQQAGGFVGQCTLENNNREPYEVTFEDCSSQVDLQCTGEQVGGFAGVCAYGSFTGCRASGRVEGAALTGGFAGELSKQRPEFALSVIQCAANGEVRQAGEEARGGFGGFAGRADGLDISQSLASGAVNSASVNSGAFLGEMSGGAALSDCYASGDLNTSQNAAGGMFGVSAGGAAEHCYYQGSLLGGADTGGIGGLCSSGMTTVQSCLVLSPSISGGTPTGRVLGGGTGSASLLDNYATTTRVLQDGQQKQIVDDPGGPDGGTISISEIVPTLQRTGWSSEIWDFSSATGGRGPQLFHTPEQTAI